MEIFLDESTKDFRAAVRHWVETKYPKSQALELEAQPDYPEELWHDMADAGFHGIGIAEEYGAQGGDVVSQILLDQGLARSLAGLVTVWGISSFAGAKAIGGSGTEDQKQRFLPALAKGEVRFAIAITESGGGTDVLGRCAPVPHRRMAGGGSWGRKCGRPARTSPTTCWSWR
jgi:alkylation response protein AidB-like acyl-CoA dehydrogenase